MPRQNKPDPYNGFKDDRERRRALNTKVRCYMVVMVTAAVVGVPINWMEKLQWLTTLLH